MNYNELAHITSQIKLPNGMYFQGGIEGSLMWVQVRKDNDVCNVTKQPGYGWEGRRWIIEDDYDESHVLRTLWACFMATMEHELREQFIYKGKLPFGPHFDVADLMEKADTVS